MDKFISWVEIPTNDFSRAIKFYNSVFKLNLEETSYDEEKMACFPTGEGAIIYAPGYKPSDNGVLVSLNTGNELDAIMLRIQENGGEIAKEKTKIEAEGFGYFAVFIDCEGNKLGLYGNN